MDQVASQIVEASGLRLHVTDTGQGLPILLLHPYPLDSDCFAPQVTALASERRVLTVDFPGFGQSPPPTSPVPFDAYARGLRELLRSRGITQLDLVGVSMGSYAALELSKLGPQLLRRLVLAGARASAPTPTARAAREAQAARAEREGVAWLVDDMAPKLLRHKPAASDLRRVEHTIARASAAGVAAAARAIAERGDQTDSAKAVRADTLVLHGAEDQITPLAEGLALAQLIAGARFEVLADTGHAPNADEPERFTRVLVSFLQR